MPFGRSTTFCKQSYILSTVFVIVRLKVRCLRDNQDHNGYISDHSQHFLASEYCVGQRLGQTSDNSTLQVVHNVAHDATNTVAQCPWALFTEPFRSIIVTTGNKDTRGTSGYSAGCIVKSLVCFTRNNVFIHKCVYTCVEDFVFQTFSHIVII